MAIYRNDNWSQLIGAFVELRLGRRYLRSGFVDDAMPDSSAIWLAADRFETRTMISKADGYELWVESSQLDDVVTYALPLVAWTADSPCAEEVPA